MAKGKSSLSGKLKVAKSKTRKRVIVEGVATTVYANNVEMLTTQWDVRLTFGQIERADETELAVREFVRVYLSPQHAVAFHAVLGKQLGIYESSYGHIPRLGPAKEDGETDKNDKKDKTDAKD